MASLFIGKTKMAEINLCVTVKQRSVDADGSKCLVCQDSVFGNASELILVTKSGKPIGNIEGQICQSCGNGLDIETFE